MPYQPSVRQPSGFPAAPLIMVSGLPKSGKSMLSYKIGGHERIAQTWVADLGEGSADEYGQLGCYQVIEWGRSFADLADTVRWCIDQPVPEGKLNALIIDSGTDLWDTLKFRADKRARSSKRNAAALREDPDYEVDVSMPYWNDAKETWARIISPMKLAGNLIGVVLVRSEQVAEVVNGAPTNRKVTSYQCEKTLQGVVTAHVTVDMDHSARLIEVRSMHVSVPPRGVPLPEPNPLGHLLDLLLPTEGTFAAPQVHSPIDEDRLCTTEQRQMLVDLVMSVREPEMREAVKQRLGKQYGKTTEITTDRFDEVVGWLTQLITTVQGDDTAQDRPEQQMALEDAASFSNDVPRGTLDEPAETKDAPSLSVDSMNAAQCRGELEAIGYLTPPPKTSVGDLRVMVRDARRDMAATADHELAESGPYG
jgi:hypothetical protein